MRRYAVYFVILMVVQEAGLTAGTINLGAGLDYTPIVKLQYPANNNFDYEIVDNVAWQGRVSYSYGNGIRSGLIFDFLGKRIHPGRFSTTDITQWGIGIYGDYGYEITDSGHALLVCGMETGYGELKDETGDISETAGSTWIAGIAGARFMIGGAVWLDIDYRLSSQRFELNTEPRKKYLFSGSSLRITLDLPIYSTTANAEDK